jgi:hypothetical protein
VDLGDPLRIEARLLELAVDVRREDERGESALPDPPAQDLEPAVREGRAVEREPVAVEAPAERRVGLEVRRVRGLDEAVAEPLVRRVRLPEPAVAPEVGQPGVDAHAGASADDEGVRLADRVCGPAGRGFERGVHAGDDTARCAAAGAPGAAQCGACSS